MNSVYDKKIGHNLKVLREKRKMTQEELSAKLQVMGCDITRSALAKIEVAQRHIYPDEILAFKKIFNVSFEEIFKE
ncbi:MAG: helix-turn-helix transcriptional regulator [Clostridia bacterium]|nr:helix-turn-helix transcriptional regulator [Clostridia bacterium]